MERKPGTHTSAFSLIFETLCPKLEAKRDKELGTYGGGVDEDAATGLLSLSTHVFQGATSLMLSSAAQQMN